MTRLRAALGSAAFFAAAPCVVAGIVPWALTGWDAHAWPLPLRVVGVVLIAIGLPVLVHAFVRFVLEGAGTPAPVAPTERLVVGGLYRYVRNPMYLAVTSVIVGQALLLGRPVLLVWAAAVLTACWSFVHWYEEPALERRFGEDYVRYRSEVPGWMPRLTRRAARGAR